MSIAYPPLTEPRPDHPSPPEQRSPRPRLSARTFTVWGPKFAISILDQGLTSGAGLFVNLLLARSVGAEIYGAFAVAFVGFLFIAGFHNVLLLEPMSVMGPADHSNNLPQYFSSQLKIHLLQTSLLSIVALLTGTAIWYVAHDSPLVGAVFGGGIALPFLLLLWLVRRMCYVARRPSVALSGSLFNLVFVVTALFVLSRLSWLGSFTAFLSMGIGSLLVSIFMFRRLGVWQSLHQSACSATWRVVFVENWIYGRWLIGSTVLFSISNQAQTFIVAGFVGLAGAGTLRAMQLPALVMTQIVAAASILALPSFAAESEDHDFGNLRFKAYATSLLLGGLAFVYVLVLLGFSKGLAWLLFHGKFAGRENLMSLLALSPVFMALNVGPNLFMRAIRKPQFDLLVSLFAAPVGLISGIVMITKWGVWGAAWSSVLTLFLIFLGNFLFFENARWRQRFDEWNLPT